MKILSIGSDQKLFENGSEVQRRVQEYGMLFEELHIIVYTRHQTAGDQQLTTNVWVYPTNTRWKPLYFWQAYQIAKLLVISHQLSIITCQDPFETGLVGWLLKKRFRLPLQLQVHTDVFSPYFWKESLKNKVRVLLARFLLPRADSIRVVSQRIKDSLDSRATCHTSRVTILPIFVDVRKIQSAKVKTNLHQKYPDHDFIILMASRLTKEKNIGMAIGALLSVKRQASSVKNPLLLIVGEGPEKENLELYIKRLTLNANIKFEPPTKDLISYYKTADLFLLTSNYEGYGRTVVEAMAAGTPVIITDVGLAGEILIDDLDGKIIPVGDSASLVEAILFLLRESKYKKRWLLETEKLLESFPTKDDYLKEFREALEKIL